MTELIPSAVGAAFPSENRTLKLRAGNPVDAQACGEICDRAFEKIAAQHNFSSDLLATEAACSLMSRLFDATPTIEYLLSSC
jgi:hypothetical protein